MASQFTGMIQISGRTYRLVGEASLMDWTPLAVCPVGGHVWENAGVYVAHPNRGLLTALVPSSLFDWPDLAAAAALSGPAAPMMAMYEQRAQALLGTMINCMAYVPEHPETAGNVPVDEALHLETYLPQAQSIAQAQGCVFVYGPGSRLYADPATWQYGARWDWQVDRIQTLAAMLVPGSVILIRPFTVEAKYKNAGQEAEYAATIADLADLWLAGNPTLCVVVHIALQPGDTEVQRWLARREALIAAMGANLHSVYAGMRPESQTSGSTAALQAVFAAIGG